MSRYRPLPCLGIALADLAPCAGCMRLVSEIPAGKLQIRPEINGGRCGDFIAGRRPNAPTRVSETPRVHGETE